MANRIRDSTPKTFFFFHSVLFYLIFLFNSYFPSNEIDEYERESFNTQSSSVDIKSLDRIVDLCSCCLLHLILLRHSFRFILLICLFLWWRSDIHFVYSTFDYLFLIRIIDDRPILQLNLLFQFQLITFNSAWFVRSFCTFSFILLVSCLPFVSIDLCFKALR